MSCCGQTAQQAQAAAHRTLDERTAALTHVRLVYVGADKRVHPFVAAGKVYQFGNNERRRTNVVAAAAVPKLLAAGLFEVFDPERHNEDGTARQGDQPPENGTGGVDKVTSDQVTEQANIAVTLSPSHPVTLSGSSQPTEAPQTASAAGLGELTPPAAPSPASASPVQPAATVRTKPAASKK
jgi:hypothetical protein